MCREAMATNGRPLSGGWPRKELNGLGKTATADTVSKNWEARLRPLIHTKAVRAAAWHEKTGWARFCCS